MRYRNSKKRKIYTEKEQRCLIQIRLKAMNGGAEVQDLDKMESNKCRQREREKEREYLPT